jgi:hypothetical protein
MKKYLLALLAGLCVGQVARASDQEQFVFDLYHFAGNLSQAQRDALLASPQWKVSASYSPRILIPGITAHWGKDGVFFQMLTLLGDTKTVELTGSEIQRQGTELRFSLPKQMGFPQFRLSSFRISLPLAGFDNEFRLDEMYFVEEDKTGRNELPALLKASTFFLAGALKTQGMLFRGSNQDPGTYGHGWMDGSGEFGFWPLHRFAFYRQPSFFQDKPGHFQYEPKSLDPLPAELRNMKIYRATMLTRRIDGHRIDFVDISATEEREDCSSDDLKYEILYVDGMPISYTRRNPDPKQCRVHYRYIEWGSDGKPFKFGGTLDERGNHGSQVSNLNWNANCRSVDSGKYSVCDAPPPTQVQIAEVVADARRVRGWFFSE